MSKKIQLSIPKPCHEDWDAMSPVEKGKFCGSCQKQVIDFSTMSDRQVAEFFKKPILSLSKGGSVCGRFMADQLERDIEIPKKRLPWFKYFFSIALPAFFFARAGAQNGQKMGKVKTATRDTMPTNINQEYRTMGMVALPDKFIPVEKGNQKGEWGKVVDAATGSALPGAEVCLFSTIGKEKIHVKRDGSFIIDIYRKITVDRIEISMPGYISKTLSLVVFLEAANAKEVIQMEREDMIVGKIAMPVCEKPLIGDTTVLTIKGEIRVMPVKSRIINGLILDENDQPVPWASILIKGTRTGVVSNEKGEFKIKVKGDDKLVVACPDFNAAESIIGREDSVRVYLKRIDPMSIAGFIVVKSSNKNPKDIPLYTPIPANVPFTSFKVFPNPVQSGSSITIEWKQTEEGYYSLELISQAGQAVHQREIWIDAEARQLSFDTPVVAAGSYFLVLTNKRSGKKFPEKIIVQ